MSTPQQSLATWGANKSVRLGGFDYREHVPYHTIVRTVSGHAPFIDQEMAATACRMLSMAFDSMHAYLGTYCLMPDHLHLLLSPDRSGLSVGQIIARFKGRTTRESWSLGWAGRLWQTRFYDHIVRKSEDIAAVARYIYENPDRRGLAGDYPFRWIDPALGARMPPGA